MVPKQKVGVLDGPPCRWYSRLGVGEMVERVSLSVRGVEVSNPASVKQIYFKMFIAIIWLTTIGAHMYQFSLEDCFTCWACSFLSSYSCQLIDGRASNIR